MPNTLLESLVFNSDATANRSAAAEIEWQSDSARGTESLSQPVRYAFLDSHPLTRDMDYLPFTRHPFLDGDKQPIVITNLVHELPSDLKDKKHDRDALVSGRLDEDYMDMLVKKCEEAIHFDTTLEVKEAILANKIDTLVRMLHPTLVLEELSVSKVAQSLDATHRRLLPTTKGYQELMSERDRRGQSTGEYLQQTIEECKEAGIDEKEIKRIEEFGMEAFFDAPGEQLREDFHADLETRDSYRLMRQRATLIISVAMSDEMDQDAFMNIVDPKGECEIAPDTISTEVGATRRDARSPRIGRYVGSKFVTLG